MIWLVLKSSGHDQNSEVVVKIISRQEYVF